MNTTVSMAFVLVQLLLHLFFQPEVVHAAQQQSDASLAHHQRQLHAFGGGRSGGGFGGFRASASRPATAPSRPAQGPVATGYPVRPAGGVVTGYPAARPGGVVTGYPVRTAGPTALPGGFSTYGRTGFRSTPFLLPFGAGLLAGSAASHLARSPTAYCNGRDVQCYKNACQQALTNKCPEAAAGNATLVLTACPDTRYSECYQTQDFNNTAAASFECFGARRPKYGQEDLAAVCHQPGASSSSAGSSRSSKVGLVAFTSAVLLLVLL